MPPPGRVSKLTPGIQDAIAQGVAMGLALETAATLADVKHATVQAWMARGEDRHPSLPSAPIFVAFAAAIKKARAAHEATCLQRIVEASRGGVVTYRKTTTFADGRTVIEERYQPPQWVASAWILERSRPDQWGRRQVVDMYIDIKAVVERIALEAGLDAEDVLAEAEGLLKALDHEAY